jgi:hypothetical protein
MTRHRLFYLCVATSLLLGCTSNTELVKKMAAVELQCNESDLSITHRSGTDTNGKSYEARGCNQTQTYMCDRWSYGVSMATTGYSINPVCAHAW